MLKEGDLIQIRCEQNMIQAGLAEASQAAALPGRFPRLNSFDRLRLRAADGIASLALRRILSRDEIPHQLAPSPHFNRTGGYDAVLGGRRCLPVAQMICRRGSIRRYSQDPAALIGRTLFLPEMPDWDAYGAEDLFVFVFIFSLVTRSREAIKKALVAGQPLHLLYCMPSGWGLPECWAPLETLVLKTDLSRPVALTLHGQDGHQRYHAEQVKLEARRRIEVETELFAIGALGIDRLPLGPVGIHHPGSQMTLLVAPYQWGNVWLYASRIVLPGYIRCADFFRQAEPANLAEACAANPCLREESLLALPVSSLKSLPDLFRRAEVWAAHSN
jgi:hypothetical protein